MQRTTSRRRRFDAGLVRSRATAKFLLAAAGVAVALTSASNAAAQTCPIGRHCFYVPAAMPDVGGHDVGNHAWDFIISVPFGTATGTYSIHGGAPVPFAAMAGTRV